MAQRGTPYFSVRLNKRTQTTLKQLAKIYGSSTPSAFAREMITVMVSGDAEKIHEFNYRLFKRVGEKAQLQLELADKRKEARRAKSP